jgi:DNA mismatch repair protein MutL
VAHDFLLHGASAAGRGGGSSPTAPAGRDGPSTLTANRDAWAFDPPRATTLAEPAGDPWGLSGTGPQTASVETLDAAELAGLSTRGPDDDAIEPAPRTRRTVPPTIDASLDTSKVVVTVHNDLFSEEKGFYASLRYVGQVKRMFLLCEASDGLYILDQHAAAERVTFDRLRKAYGRGEVAMQPLLIPCIVQASPAEVVAAEVLEAEGSRMGLEIGPHGPHAIAVRAVPAMLRRTNPEVLARDLLSEWMLEAQRPFADRLDMVFATMACHGSLRGGDAVTEGEARALLESLDGVDFGGHCPHGRPVVTRMSFSELERRVGRP